MSSDSPRTWLHYQLTNSKHEKEVIENERLSSSYDVYGYKFTITGPAGKAYSGACQDFLYFKSKPCDDANLVEIIDAYPDYEALPEVEASIYTPRNVVFKLKGVSYIDYQGRGIGIHDKKTNNFGIQSRDADLLYEAVYLFLLSQIPVVGGIAVAAAAAVGVGAMVVTRLSTVPPAPKSDPAGPYRTSAA